MKKIYSKPEILFENFTLSTNVAGDCGKIVTTHAENVCGIYFTGIGNVFMTGTDGCSDLQVTSDDGQFNGICYHVPTETNLLFNS